MGSSTDAPAEDLVRSRSAFAQGMHQEGLALAQGWRARDAGDNAPLTAQAAHLCAMHLWRLGRFEEALQAAREAQQLESSLAPEEACDLASLMCLVHGELGRNDEALEAARAAFQLAKEHRLEAKIAQGLNRLGVCYDRSGRPEEAEQFHLQALQQARTLKDEALLLSTLNSLTAVAISSYFEHTQRGEAAQASRAVQRALPHGEEALALARRLGDPYRLATVCGNFGEAQGLAGHPQEARALLQEAIATARRHGYRGPELRHRYDLADVMLREGEVAEAIEMLEALARELRPDDQENTRLRMHAALQRAYKQTRQFERALEHAEAWQVLEMRRIAAQFSAHAKMMVNRVHLEMAEVRAEQARLEAEVERLQRHALEMEKRELEMRAAVWRRDAEIDALTGLPNRRSFVEAYRLLGAAAAPERPLTLVLCDIDHFKQVNDRLGHVIGDEVLRRVAQLLGETTRPDDLVARVGGEEFAALLPGSRAEAALSVCERLRGAVETHDWSAAHPGLGVTASFGIVVLDAVTPLEEAMQRADAALYSAKHQGRNRVCIA